MSVAIQLLLSVIFTLILFSFTSGIYISKYLIPFSLFILALVISYPPVVRLDTILIFWLFNVLSILNTIFCDDPILVLFILILL